MANGKKPGPDADRLKIDGDPGEVLDRLLGVGESARFFSKWLATQRERTDEVGRFAREAFNDGNAVDWDSRQTCIDDLAGRGAKGWWIDAAQIAWDEYER